MSLASPLAEALRDRYVLERELGHGGMATVYLARDVRHQRLVALKVLRPDLASALGGGRFVREITIAAQLQHPHILPLHDSGETNGFLYYVMPYVEGESLREKLTREGFCSIAEGVRILREVVDALSYAHAHGVIHRDIKPGNVLLSGRHALVSDFGVAKAVSEAATREELTTVGVALGTPAYMAPEQAVADPQVDHRADLYSVGVLAYELLTGSPPFIGLSPQMLLAAHVMTPVQPIRVHRRDVPPALEAVVMRCLEKDPAKRWPSADALLAALEDFATPSGGTTPTTATSALRRKARSYVLVTVLAVATVLALLGITYQDWRRGNSDAVWVKEQAIPRIQQLADSGKWDGAFKLAVSARERRPADSTLAMLWPRFSTPVTIHSEPPGASVHRTAYTPHDTGWQYLGTTPLDNVPFPHGFSRLKLEKEGLPAVDLAAFAWTLPKRPFVLEDSATQSDGLVRVPGGEIDVNLPGLDQLKAIELGDYRIGRHEVTNREFQGFVDAGGYGRREHWDHDFLLAGKKLSWEEAVARFRDKTGRPGPAGWEAGHYPSQLADYPVTGVSWYEAAAYAKFAGKQLPTVFHWSRAAFTWGSAQIVPLSNFKSRGLAAAGVHRGMGPYGTFDMAGNAREWCLNASENQRYILGGGWDDPAYAFNDAYAQSPFDRSHTNGFRLAQYVDSTNLALAARPIDRLFRDYSKEKPVPDHTFQVYRRMYDYDRLDLSSNLEAVDSSAEGWIRERVSFTAAYGGERVIAHLFLPKDRKPPYQTVIYFPGSDAIHDRSSSELDDTWIFDFILKSGRAVMYPVYKSTYERGDSLRSDFAEQTHAYKEHVIMWGKDLRRSIDYLETRAEIDTARLAYYGASWGGVLGGLLPAIESRLKVGVLLVAGLPFQRALPEVDPLNYLPRIRIPVLMLNGQYDHYFPVETSQIPMFRLLGTPPSHKRQVISEGGHFVPRSQLIREVLDWLDRYFGRVH